MKRRVPLSADLRGPASYARKTLFAPGRIQRDLNRNGTAETNVLMLSGENFFSCNRHNKFYGSEKAVFGTDGPAKERGEVSAA